MQAALARPRGGDIKKAWNATVDVIHQYPSQPIAAGDKVLVIGEDTKHFYVIGLLTPENSEPGGPPRRSATLKMKNGACAVVDHSNSAADTGVLQIFSKRKELLFEYDPDAEKVRVMVASGDLEFSTHNGNITLSSAHNINLNAQDIVMTGRTGFRLGVADAVGKLRSVLSIGPQKMKLNSPEVDMTAKRSLLHIDETRYVANRFHGKIGYVQLMTQKLETAARTIIETAENIYQTVRSLSQLKAGRKRTVIDSTYHLKAKRGILKTDDDFKVMADKIHLG